MKAAKVTPRLIQALLGKAVLALVLGALTPPNAEAQWRETSVCNDLDDHLAVFYVRTTGIFGYNAPDGWVARTFQLAPGKCGGIEFDFSASHQNGYVAFQRYDVPAKRWVTLTYEPDDEPSRYFSIVKKFVCLPNAIYERPDSDHIPIGRTDPSSDTPPSCSGPQQFTQFTLFFHRDKNMRLVEIEVHNRRLALRAIP